MLGFVGGGAASQLVDTARSAGLRCLVYTLRFLCNAAVALLAVVLQVGNDVAVEADEAKGGDEYSAMLLAAVHHIENHTAHVLAVVDRDTQQRSEAGLRVAPVFRSIRGEEDVAAPSARLQRNVCKSAPSWRYKPPVRRWGRSVMRGREGNGPD